jgi:hypothetical protein
MANFSVLSVCSVVNNESEEEPCPNRALSGGLFYEPQSKGDVPWRNGEEL